MGDPNLGVTHFWAKMIKNMPKCAKCVTPVWGSRRNGGKTIGKQKVLRHTPALAPICVAPVLGRKGFKTRGYKTGNPGVPGR